ncbi:protein kinase [Streptomyces sp. NPDC051014]|uniref:phthiocerol/phthiodiolone dimycocerosyl transferase family protein n=1 Tax=Streptomyces sp. NPDC051014 TaxID=3155751 RepID=UPI0034046920
MQRELCPVENLYVAQRSRAVVSCALSGPVDVMALSAAFDTVTARHPTLLAHLVTEGPGHHLRLLPPSRRPRLESRTGGDDVYGELLNDPLPVGGPLARATLASTPDGIRHLFVLVIDHVITDGRNAIALLNAVWDRYGEVIGTASADGSAPAPGPGFPPPVATLLPLTDAADTAAYRERRIEQSARPPELVAYDTLPGTRGEADCEASGPSEGTARIEVRRLSLGTAHTGRLRAVARDAGLSVHGLVAAAVLLAARGRLTGEGPRHLRCMSPVDLRARLRPPLPAEVAVASVTAHLCDVEVCADSDPLDLARQVSGGLREFFDRGDHFRELRIMPDAVRYPHLQLGTVIVTNMGVVAGPRLPDGLRMRDVRLVPAREHYFPQAGRSPLMACVVSFDDRLAVEFPHHTACFSAAFAGRLRDDVRATLLALADVEVPSPFTAA